MMKFVAYGYEVKTKSVMAVGQEIVTETKTTWPNYSNIKIMFIN